MEPARLDTRLNESRLVIDRTPREVQLFAKFYYLEIPEKTVRFSFSFPVELKLN